MSGAVVRGEPLAGPADYGPLALQGRLGGAGTWEVFTYGGPPGSRRYFVYTPAGYTIDRCVPMVVMLHGCTQTPADSAVGTEWNLLADQQGFVVVYPEQGGGDNSLSCWNWFLPEHQVRGSGEAGVIAGISQQVLTSETQWNIDTSRVYIAGMSAGGAMATIVGATYPDLYAAIGVHAGLEYQAATSQPAAFEAMAKRCPRPRPAGSRRFNCDERPPPDNAHHRFPRHRGPRGQPRQR